MPMLSPTQFRNLDLQNNLVLLTSIVQQPQDKRKLVEICVAPYCVKKNCQDLVYCCALEELVSLFKFQIHLCDTFI